MYFLAQAWLGLRGNCNALLGEVVSLGGRYRLGFTGASNLKKWTYQLSPKKDGMDRPKL